MFRAAAAQGGAEAGARRDAVPRGRRAVRRPSSSLRARGGTTSWRAAWTRASACSVRGNGFPDPDVDACESRRAAARRSASPRTRRRPLRRADRRREGHRASARGGARSCRTPISCWSGPDDRHGAIDRCARRRRRGRVHVARRRRTSRRSTSTARRTSSCLPSAGESFGMVAAEAAAAGTPVDRHRPLRHRELLPARARRSSFPTTRPRVVDARAAACSATPELRARLAVGGVAAARRMSWDARDRPPGGDLPRGDRLAARLRRRLSTDGS